MTAIRFVMAILMIVVGAWMIVSFLRVWVWPEIVIGLFLGIAIVVLGVHKASLILRVWKTQQ